MVSFQPLVSLNQVSLSYGGHQALDNVSLNLLPGRVTGLIGPNGAGKSSLIKTLCGRIDPTLGEIAIDGQVLSPLQSRASMIGLVPQDIALYPFMSARENLSTFAKLLGVPKSIRTQTISNALTHVDMLAKADTLVENMSGGMKRRINVAAAIMHNPKLLILDEPTAGVDTPARDAIHQLLKKLAASGMSVLLVSHELEEVETFCDDVIFLSNGRVLAHTSSQNILRHVFGHNREVVVDFAYPPNQEQMKIISRFSLHQGHVPTRWQIFTPINNQEYLTELIKALETVQPPIRDLSIRRPNLTRLMEIVERTGSFPSMQS